MSVAGHAGSVMEAAADADVLLLLTEWREFTEADPEILGKVVARRTIADGRNVLDQDEWRRAGLGPPRAWPTAGA